MSETSVRPVASIRMPAATEVAPSAVPNQPIRDNSDSVDTPRSYIVIGTPEQLQLAPPSFAKALRGTMPAGDAWTTSSLTQAQADALRRAGLTITENQTVRHPPIIPSAPRTPSLAAFSPRAVHEADELAALGPEWQGKGGLYISLDTGAAVHPDLKKPLYFDDVTTDAPDDPQKDNETHGTHTLGLGVANGDPAKGGMRGMAPDADWAAAAVLDKRGEGTDAMVLKGIEDAVKWARLHPDSFVVVNMSLGDTPRDPATDPIVLAVEQATQKYGILFSISAGNSGPRAGSIETPGTSPDAITVGAMDHSGTLDVSDDRVAWFSSRDKVGGNKPSLTADGVNVRSTVPGGYTEMDGTSMASPVAGGGLLDLGQGLLAMYKRGDLLTDPRDLVRSGEFQRIVMEATLDNPKVPSNVEGAGDLRLKKAYDLFVARYGANSRHGPAPYFPGPTPPALRLPPAPYALPFSHFMRAQ